MKNKIDNLTKMNVLSNTWKGKLSSMIELSIISSLMFSGAFYFVVLGTNGFIGTDKHLLNVLMQLSVCMGVFFGSVFGLSFGVTIISYKFMTVKKSDYLEFVNKRKEWFDTKVKNYKNAAVYYQSESDKINAEILSVDETFPD